MNRYKPLVALILVAVIGLVGSTFAYFTNSVTITHEFAAGTYKVVVEEEFVSPTNWTPGTTTSLMTTVRNESSMPVTARAKYTEYWVAADGTQLDLRRNGKRIAQFKVNTDTWKRSSDGYYYYDKTLDIGETSTSFIDSVTFNKDFELIEGVDIECVPVENADGSTGSRCSSLTSGYGGATYYLEITIETAQVEENWAPIIANVVLPTDEELAEMQLEDAWDGQSVYIAGFFEYFPPDSVTAVGGMLRVMHMYGNMEGIDFDVRVLEWTGATISRNSVDEEWNEENLELEMLYYVDEETFPLIQSIASELGVDLTNAGPGWNSMLLDEDFNQTGVLVKVDYGPTIPSWVPEEAFEFKHPYFDEVVQVQ